MLVPDCRSDFNYNEDFLNGKDSSEIRGYDWCAEEVVDNFFDNLDVYFDDCSYLMNALNTKLPDECRGSYEMKYTFGDKKSVVRTVTTYKDLLRSKLLDWIESSRDELITSMIDNMDDEEYEVIRNRVLKDNEKLDIPKEYYDSRKHILTGQKVLAEPDISEE